MHGSVFHGYKQFVQTRGGAEQWDQIARAAGVPGWYLATKS